MALDSFKRLLTRAGREELRKETPLNKPSTDTEKQELEERKQVPVAEVLNEVIYVNPAFENPDFFHSSPHPLRVGQPTTLGIFAGQVAPEQTGRKQRTAEGTHGHHRSLILGHGIFRDDGGRLYRDVDAKGIGFLPPTIDGVISASPIERGGPTQGMLGIFERGMAERDASLAEEFISRGIRTYRVIAITKLDELVDDGKRYPIDEAKRRGIIPDECEPVISIRAFGTRDRIRDISYHTSSKSIDAARLLVAQELGRDPQEFGRKEYFHWFVETLAENVARMHKAHLVHGYLTSHNITLDCRIVDLDSVHPGPEIYISDILEQLKKLNFGNPTGPNPYSNDLFEAIDSLGCLDLQTPRGPDSSNWLTDFKKKYSQILETTS